MFDIWHNMFKCKLLQIYFNYKELPLQWCQEHCCHDATCKRHRKQQRLLVNNCGIAEQLPLVVATFAAAFKQQDALQKEYKKPAASNNLPLGEGNHVQSTNLCLLCCGACWHSSAVF